MSSDVAKATYPVEPVQLWRMNKNDAIQARSKKQRPVKIGLERVSRSYGTFIHAGPSGYYCPQCNHKLTTKNEKMSDEWFFKQRKPTKQGWSYVEREDNIYCQHDVAVNRLPAHAVIDKTKERQKCNFHLWRAATLKPDSLERKVSPAWYINKYLPKGFFRYLIADEVHQYKGENTDRANAFGQLINCTTKQILLTGTLVGGMAKDIFYLIARLDSRRLKREGIQYHDKHLFVERYGVYENKNKFLGNGQTRKTKIEKPGISPQVFTRYLISNCMFLELSDLGYVLPSYTETPVFIPMNSQHKQAYNDMEERLGSIMRSNVARGGMRFISLYITNMYQYCDYPFFPSAIYGVNEDGESVRLYQPQSFDIDAYTPEKFNTLCNMIDDQIARDRKSMVYVKFTGKHAVDTYLYDKLKALGYKVGILRREGKYDGIEFPKREHREQWLHDQMDQHNWDVLITNSDLVSVGLNLIMFPTIFYYQMDYSTYNYMQSSRRSWRIKQTKPVEIYTLVYSDTIQADILSTIAKKMDAALALQGKFSEEGLRAMSESTDGLNALAKRLISEGRLESIDSIESRWKKINESRAENKLESLIGYEHYGDAIMNPLGLERIRDIQKGVVEQKQEQVKQGTLSQRELDDYMEMIQDMFAALEDVKEINKSLRKKDQLVEGQLMFMF